MKKVFFISIILLSVFIIIKNFCTTNAQTRKALKQKGFAELLSLTDAQKILGEPGKLDDSSTTWENNALMYKCSYKANAEDVKTKKTGHVYFLIEKYTADSSAHNKYAFIKKANEDHGIKTLTNLGDEAYFHTDSRNFYFIMARKGTKVFNMKVNRLTSKTSLNEFNIVSRKIVDGM